MAKGRKTGGRDFVPGDTRAGRPPLPPELREARRLNKTEFERLANKYLWAGLPELDAAIADPATPAFERLLVSIMVAGIKDGDHAKAEWFAMRLLGKVKDQVEVSQPKPFAIYSHNAKQNDPPTIVLGAAIEAPKD